MGGIEQQDITYPEKFEIPLKNHLLAIKRTENATKHMFISDIIHRDCE
jgi:hypothetical protein